MEEWLVMLINWCPRKVIETIQCAQHAYRAYYLKMISFSYEDNSKAIIIIVQKRTEKQNLILVAQNFYIFLENTEFEFHNELDMQLSSPAIFDSIYTTVSKIMSSLELLIQYSIKA